MIIQKASKFFEISIFATVRGSIRLRPLPVIVHNLGLEVIASRTDFKRKRSHRKLDIHFARFRRESSMVPQEIATLRPSPPRNPFHDRGELYVNRSVNSVMHVKSLTKFNHMI